MRSFNDSIKDILSVIVRLSGLALLFIGMWILIQTFNEALSLYKEPKNIESLAVTVAAGSGIDKVFMPTNKKLEPQEKNIIKDKKPANSNFRISYFVAWVINLLLLLLLARISIMAIKTGGELCLYDTQIKEFARQLIKNK